MPSSPLSPATETSPLRHAPRTPTNLAPLAMYCFVAARGAADAGCALAYCAAAHVATKQASSPKGTGVASRDGGGSSRLRQLGMQRAFHEESRHALLASHPQLPSLIFPDRLGIDPVEPPSTALCLAFAATRDDDRSGGEREAPTHAVIVRVSAALAIGVLSPLPYFSFFAGFAEVAARQLQRWARVAGVPPDAAITREALNDAMQPLLELTVGNGAVNGISIRRGAPFALTEWDGAFGVAPARREHGLAPSTRPLMRPNEQLLLAADVPISSLLYAFSYEQIRVLQSVIAAGERIVFVAESFAQASACALTAACAVMAPLRWRHLCLPVVPRAALGVLQTTTPFIAGTAAHALAALLLLPLPHVWIADCRCGIVASSTMRAWSSPEAPLELLPHSERLKTALKRHVPKPVREQWMTVAGAAQVPATPPALTPPSQVGALAAFVDYTASALLANYRLFVTRDGSVHGRRLDVARCLGTSLSGVHAQRLAHTAMFSGWASDILALEAARAALAARGTPFEIFLERCARLHPTHFPELQSTGGISSGGTSVFDDDRDDGDGGDSGAGAGGVGDNGVTRGAATGARRRFFAIVSKAKESLRSAVASQPTHAPTLPFFAATGGRPLPAVVAAAAKTETKGGVGGAGASPPPSPPPLSPSQWGRTEGCHSRDVDSSCSSLSGAARLPLNALVDFELYHELLAPLADASFSAVAAITDSPTAPRAAESNGGPARLEPPHGDGAALTEDREAARRAVLSLEDIVLSTAAAAAPRSSCEALPQEPAAAPRAQVSHAPQWNIDDFFR